MVCVRLRSPTVTFEDLEHSLGERFRALHDAFDAERGGDADAFGEWLVDQEEMSVVDLCVLHVGATVTRVPREEEEESTPAPAGIAVPSSARYRRLAMIGKGAMGEVHLARDPMLDRHVALKTLPRSRRGGSARRSFMEEVRITAQLDHPQIVPVYGFENDDDGSPAYAMKLLIGRTLDELIDDVARAIEATGRAPERYDLRGRMEVFLKICDAVHYAHDRRVVHRDLKPTNVMVGRHGEVWVLDWGIALLQADPARADGVGGVDEAGSSMERTRIGQVIGTPMYMAPEQARGDIGQIRRSTDVFALGLMLQELAVLAPAREAGSVSSVLDDAVLGRRRPMDDGRVGEPIPQDLVAVVDHATHPDQARRYPSVAELAADVRRVLGDEETAARPDDALRALRRKVARNHRTILGIAVVTLLVAAVALASNRMRERARLAEALIVAHARDRAVETLFADVSARAQHIDNHFLWYEGQLEGLASGARQVLLHAAPADLPTYRYDSFVDFEAAAPDALQAPHYGRIVSPSWPTWKVPLGMAPAVFSADLERLGHLRSRMIRVLEERPDGSALTQEQLSRVMAAGEDQPLEWAYVALEASGLIYILPGAAGWEESYDPRTRPWYRQAVDRGGKGWGRPYVDLMGQGRLLSAGVPILDDHGVFLGVVGLDLQVDWLIDAYLAFPDQPEVLGSWLVDEQGRVMLSEQVRDTPFEVPRTDKLDAGLDFGSFPDPAVQELIAAERSGTHRSTHAGRLHRTMVARLEHLGWSLVVSAEEPR